MVDAKNSLPFNKRREIPDYYSKSSWLAKAGSAIVVANLGKPISQPAIS